MNHVSAAIRSLVLLICCIGITAPVSADESIRNHMGKRQLVAEMITWAVTFEMNEDRYDSIDQILRDSVTGGVDVLSAAVRKTGGEVISLAGNHLNHWTLAPSDRSTPTQVQVPLYEDGKRVATVEVRFSTYAESSPPNRLYFADVIALYISPDWLERNQHRWLSNTLRRPVKRHRYVLSVAVRRARTSEIIASVGDHEKLWKKYAEDTRFAKKLSAPVYREDEEVAIVEVIVKTVTGVDVLNRLLF